jgi:hypothetical protein
MKNGDTQRLQQIIAKLSEAIEVFRRSGSKPAIGDIEVETQLGLLTLELKKRVATETRSRAPW